MDYSKLKQSSSWRTDTISSQNAIDEKLRPWMTNKGSLTAALTTLSDNNFQVRLLDQAIAVPYLHEQQILNRPLSRVALIRVVELEIHGKAVVYARSIIPLSLAKNGLDNLGRKPLGHVLFKDGNIRVSKREFAEFQVDETTIPARRTPYDYQGSRVLVTELFLPTLKNWL